METLEGTKQLTGMECREFPQATFEFMRCQIGEYDTVKVKTGRFREVLEKVFHVKAFGKTWDDAIDMLERSKSPEND